MDIIRGYNTHFKKFIEIRNTIVPALLNDIWRINVEVDLETDRKIVKIKEKNEHGSVHQDNRGGVEINANEN